LCHPAGGATRLAMPRQQNDRRAALKRQINELLGSGPQEE
jgi:hypothetical protein